MFRAVFVLSLFVLSVLCQDDPIDCSQDSDCPEDKPYCNNQGHCSFCLPPDSPPPFDYCKEWIDEHGEPIFVEHAFNCSRFWECETNGDVCLFECPSCVQDGSTCPEGALYFDASINWPEGPVCNWPVVIDCENKPNNATCPLPCQHFDEDFICSPECCQDADCPAEKPLCNADGICKNGCRENEDCDNWNGMCPGCQWCDKPGNVEIGQCKPGCLTDDQCGPSQNCVDHICKDNCLLPCQTVVNGACQPECCQDADCPTGKPLCNAEGLCTDGCRKSSDCDGYDRPCHEPWQQGDDNCEYCDNVDTSDDIGQCQPGCDDAHDMCPDNNVCDGTHNCNQEGATLIKQIHLTTATCAGCGTAPAQEGGARVHIDGVRHACTTRGLDRPDVVDYADGLTADFMSKQDADIMGQCNNAEIGPSGPKNATLEWTGTGTWTPRAVVLEVSGSYQYNCQPSGGAFGGIATGDSPVYLACEFV